MFEIKDIKHIDAIIISHDHYDHLDYDSIQQLKTQDIVFFVPLGVASHLEYWGISKKRIVEMEWGDRKIFNGLEIVH